MTQHGLIKKFLECVGCTDANRMSTPAALQPVGSDVNGPRHEEEWEYASAVGMLMYLAGNAYPEIQYAVHQCVFPLPKLQSYLLAPSTLLSSTTLYGITSIRILQNVSSILLSYRRLILWNRRLIFSLRV